ncbi:hypothetical protein BT69DRAFT_511558 [Atractiella rhizophila]|nr:hypothetical protein BT69DRAFT_511558 [Atractiella rhizophila]
MDNTNSLTIRGSGDGPQVLPPRSCDACRLRRVKCSRPLPSESSACNGCTKRGIRCTVDRTMGKRKSRRDGMVIQQAIDKFGAASPPANLATLQPQSEIEKRLVLHHMDSNVRLLLLNDFLSSPYSPPHLYDWDVLRRALTTSSPSSDSYSSSSSNGSTLKDRSLAPSQEALCELVMGFGARSSNFFQGRPDVRQRIWNRSLSVFESQGLLSLDVGPEIIAALFLLTHTASYRWSTFFFQIFHSSPSMGCRG